MTFAHLHVHSQYSVLDGHGTVEDYVKAAKLDGQQALALTDHGSVAGAIELYKATKAAGIKPIIGCELYVDLETLNEKPYPYHLTVLAVNERGYRALLRANTLAARQFYYRPRLLWLDALENAADWILLTGCPSSPINVMLRNEQAGIAEVLVRDMKARARAVFVEFQHHSSDDPAFDEMQTRLIEHQRALCVATDTPGVLTNDCHYVSAEQEVSHQNHIKLVRERDPKAVTDIEFDGFGFHLKPGGQMREVAGALGLDGAYCNASEIPDLVDIHISEADKVVWYVPKPKIDPLEAIDQLCLPKLNALGGEYTRRYEYEMSVVAKSQPIMNSYLVAYAITQACREQGIPITGRGSMAGSIISWLLGITREDPVRWNLMFERAVNPARPTIPDFDLDVSSTRRGWVLEYIARTFKDSLPIAGYTAYGPKGAARKVMRDRGYPPPEQNVLTKLLPEEWEMWDGAKEVVPDDLRPVIEGYRGLFSTTTVHPAGVAVGGPDRPLDQLTARTWIASSKQLVTSYDMYSLKKLGVFKLDILGLATLDQLEQMRKLSGAEVPDSYDDRKTLAAFQRGQTCEIFQLDGHAARNVIAGIGVYEFEDLVAVNALCRPGASQFIDTYRAGSNRLTVKYPPLDKILAYTRGVIIYQEQVMEICKVLAGFDDAEQDDIKEAIKYFRDEVFAAIEPRFMQGCAERGHDGREIFSAIKQFAGYAFNRAHAVSYAGLAYRMQWYKVHYPAIFYASVYDHSENKTRLILESHAFGVKWELPDVNHSWAMTRLIGDTIWIGLTSIKGIGPAVCDAIREARKAGTFASKADFEDRVSRRSVNVRHRDVLVRAGAMRSLNEPGTEQLSLIGVNPQIATERARWLMTRRGDYYIGGYVTQAREHIVSKGANAGKAMGYVSLQTASGEITVVLFPDVWSRFKKYRHEMLGLVFEGEWSGRTEFIGKHASA